MTFEPILDKVGRYYAARVREFGSTARGVDWNSEEAQDLRFVQLARLLPGRPFSLVDYGCGYGALVEFLQGREMQFDYQGFDIAEEMVRRAAEIHPGPQRRFTTSQESLEPAEYAVASGIFNVRLDTSVDEWSNYVAHTIDALDGLGRSGFAFNMLTSYSDAERMRADLYYADPCAMFDRCKRKYSRDVALLHDYGLYEFTILVRK